MPVERGGPDSRAPRWRRMLRAAALMVGGLFVGAVAAEGLLRIAMLVSPDLQNLNPPVLIEDPVTEHALLPGVKTRYRSPEGEFDVRVSISSQGLRDRWFAIPKAPATYRILVIGDSLVEGLQVPLDETFPKLLDRRLNTGAGRRQYEVINAGVSGMSPLVEYLNLKERLLRFEPDLVLLGFFMNDVSEDQWYRGITRFDADGQPLELLTTSSRTSFVPLAVKRFLKRHSRLAVFLMDRYHFAGGRRRVFTDPGNFEVGRPGSDMFAVLREPYTPEIIAGWEFTTGVIRYMARLLADRNIRFAIIVIPAPNQVNDREWVRGRSVWRLDGAVSHRPQEILLEFGRRNGVPTLDLVPALRASGEFPLFFPYDGHFTAAGHHATAAALFEFLVRQPWFPAP